MLANIVMGNSGRSDTRTVFGLSFSTLNTVELARYLTSATPVGTSAQLVFTANVDHVVSMRRNSAFKVAYRSAAVVTADGTPVYWYARWRGSGVPERVTGADLLPAIIDRLSAKQHHPFFVVSDEATGRRISNLVRQKHGIDTIYVVPPLGFERDEAYSDNLARNIRLAGTTHLFFCVGAPKSEVWVWRHRKLIGACFALAIGASANFLAGTDRRAPRWLRRIGGEWLWRFMRDPRRLFRRYFVDSWGFLFAIADDLAGVPKP